MFSRTTKGISLVNWIVFVEKECFQVPRVAFQGHTDSFCLSRDERNIAISSQTLIKLYDVDSGGNSLSLQRRPSFQVEKFETSLHIVFLCMLYVQNEILFTTGFVIFEFMKWNFSLVFRFIGFHLGYVGHSFSSGKSPRWKGQWTDQKSRNVSRWHDSSRWNRFLSSALRYQK